MVGKKKEEEKEKERKGKRGKTQQWVNLLFH